MTLNYIWQLNLGRQTENKKNYNLFLLTNWHCVIIKSESVPFQLSFERDNVVPKKCNNLKINHCLRPVSVKTFD